MAETDHDHNHAGHAHGETATAADAGGPDTKKGEKIPYELVSLEDKEGCVVEARVRVPWDAYQKLFDEMFGELKKSAVVDGFRKGKVPLPLLKARFRDDVRDDVITKVIPNVMEQIEEEKKIKIASDPILVDKKVEDGQSVEIAVTAEVFKTVVITDEDVRGLTVTLDDATVTDEHVTAATERDRREASVIEPAGEGAVYEKGMIIAADIAIVAPDGKVTETEYRDEQLDPETTELKESFFDNFTGRKAGDVVDIPREAQEEGQPAPGGADRVTIKSLKRRVLPALDDEFAKDLGYDSLDAYRAAAREKLEKARREDVERKAIDAVVTQVAEKKGVQIPASAVEERARHDMARLFGHMRATREQAAGLYETLKRAAEFSLKRSLILKGFKEHFQIEVTDTDVDARIEAMAAEEGRKPLAIRARLEAEKRLDALKDDLLMEALNSRILGAAGKK